MASLVTRPPAHVRRLGAAALLAAIAVLGTTTGTVADPATACAARKFDGEGFANCFLTFKELRDKGEITREQLWKGAEACCERFGGEWAKENDDGSGVCTEPADPTGGPFQLPQIPFPTEATQPPPPPPAGPIALPNMPPIQTR